MWSMLFHWAIVSFGPFIKGEVKKRGLIFCHSKSYASYAMGLDTGDWLLVLI
jgi:hypothetical protein